MQRCLAIESLYVYSRSIFQQQPNHGFVLHVNCYVQSCPSLRTLGIEVRTVLCQKTYEAVIPLDD